LFYSKFKYFPLFPFFDVTILTVPSCSIGSSSSRLPKEVGATLFIQFEPQNNISEFLVKNKF